MAAGIKLTTPSPFLTLFLPLAILALLTIAAFAHAIHNNFDILASLWTPCNGPAVLGKPVVPAPLCFAIHFFQSAHATWRGRLEQAIIVSFLAGLATITAVKSGAQSQYLENDEAGADKKKREKKSQVERAQSDWGKGGLISQEIIANLTVPWLLYSLALGALAWQGIIIPAFLYRRHQQSQSQAPSQLRLQTGWTYTDADADVVNEDAHSLVVPLSIALGLFLPATIMLLNPSAPLPIIFFLLFPLSVTLIEYLIRRLTSQLTTQSTNKFLLFLPPTIASILAHITFLLSLTTTTTTPSTHPHNDATATATDAALVLLEIDHAAIYLTTLYWIYIKTNKNIGNVLATLATTITLGPGAGICVGWLYHRDDKATESTGKEEKRKGGKATRCFFEL